MAQKNRNILVPKFCTGKSSYLKCIVSTQLQQNVSKLFTFL